MKHEHYLVTIPEKGKLIEGYKPGTYKITGTEKNENPDFNNSIAVNLENKLIKGEPPYD